MELTAKLTCGLIALAWMQGATAAGVVANEPAEVIVLELVAAPTDAVSIPAEQPGQQDSRVSVQASYDRVDRARIEQRILDRAFRTRSRSQVAERNAVARTGQAQ